MSLSLQAAVLWRLPIMEQSKYANTGGWLPSWGVSESEKGAYAIFWGGNRAVFDFEDRGVAWGVNYGSTHGIGERRHLAETSLKQ